MMGDMNRFETQSRALWLAICLLLLVGFQQTATAASTEAKATINSFHETLLKVMQAGDGMGYQERYETLQPVIANNFDTPLIAKVVLGRYWNELNNEQRQQFINIFEKLSVSTYASRFNDYAGESFEYLDTKSLNKERVLIQTQLTKSDKETVSFDYLMHQRDGKWYIMSVVAQGVNDLSLKRAEYTSIMEDKGYDGLMTELRNKIATLQPQQ